MPRHRRDGGGSRRVSTSRRVVKGYSAGRQAYDARRRAQRLSPLGEMWRELVQADACAYCGEPGVDADHIEPLSAGGLNEWENLTGSCRECNRSKRDKPLLLWMLGRARRDEAPRRQAQSAELEGLAERPVALSKG
jgi:5-methylcytosine-specific restriction endonuclease McrA